MIKVTKQIPNIREGAEGEMRMVLLPRGNFLYIKGGGQCNSIPTTGFTTRNTSQREEMGTLQKNILSVADSDDDGDYDGGGSIVNSGGGSSPGPTH